MTFVIVRSLALWDAVVPELAHADRFVLKQPRAAYLTPNNMPPDGFAALVGRLRQGRT